MEAGNNQKDSLPLCSSLGLPLPLAGQQNATAPCLLDRSTLAYASSNAIVASFVPVDPSSRVVCDSSNTASPLSDLLWPCPGSKNASAETLLLSTSGFSRTASSTVIASGELVPPASAQSSLNTPQRVLHIAPAYVLAFAGASLTSCTHCLPSLPPPSRNCPDSALALIAYSVIGRPSISLLVLHSYTCNAGLYSETKLDSSSLGATKTTRSTVQTSVSVVEQPSSVIDFSVEQISFVPRNPLLLVSINGLPSFTVTLWRLTIGADAVKAEGLCNISLQLSDWMSPTFFRVSPESSASTTATPEFNAIVGVKNHHPRVLSLSDSAEGLRFKLRCLKDTSIPFGPESCNSTQRALRALETSSADVSYLNNSKSSSNINININLNKEGTQSTANNDIDALMMIEKGSTPSCATATASVIDAVWASSMHLILLTKCSQIVMTNAFNLQSYLLIGAPTFSSSSPFLLAYFDPMPEWVNPPEQQNTLQRSQSLSQQSHNQLSLNQSSRGGTNDAYLRVSQKGTQKAAQLSVKSKGSSVRNSVLPALKLPSKTQTPSLSLFGSNADSSSANSLAPEQSSSNLKTQVSSSTNRFTFKRTALLAVTSNGDVFVFSFSQAFCDIERLLSSKKNFDTFIQLCETYKNHVHGIFPIIANCAASCFHTPFVCQSSRGTFSIPNLHVNADPHPFCKNTPFAGISYRSFLSSFQKIVLCATIIPNCSGFEMAGHSDYILVVACSDGMLYATLVSNSNKKLASNSHFDLLSCLIPSGTPSTIEAHPCTCTAILGTVEGTVYSIELGKQKTTNAESDQQNAEYAIKITSSEKIGSNIEKLSFWPITGCIFLVQTNSNVYFCNFPSCEIIHSLDSELSPLDLCWGSVEADHASLFVLSTYPEGSIIERYTVEVRKESSGTVGYVTANRAEGGQLHIKEHYERICTANLSLDLDSSKDNSSAIMSSFGRAARQQRTFEIGISHACMITKTGILRLLKFSEADASVLAVVEKELCSPYSSLPYENVVMSYKEGVFAVSSQAGNLITFTLQSKDEYFRIARAHEPWFGGTLCLTIKDNEVITVGKDLTIRSYDLTWARTSLREFTKKQQAKFVKAGVGFSSTEKQDAQEQKSVQVPRKVLFDAATKKEGLQSSMQGSSDKSKNVLAAIQAEASRIRKELEIIIEANKKLPEGPERLDPSELRINKYRIEYLDSEAVRQAKEQEDAIAQQNQELKREIADLQRRCWDSMQIQGKSTSGFKGCHATVSNYPVRKKDSSYTKRAIKLVFARYVQMLGSAFSKEDAQSKTQVILKTLNSCTDNHGSDSRNQALQFAEAESLLFSERELTTSERERMQIFFLEQCVAVKKSEFNKKFEGTLVTNSELLGKINERRARTHAIQCELTQYSASGSSHSGASAFPPFREEEPSREETPEKMWQVTDEEVGVPKYMSEEEAARLKAKRQQEEEKLRASQDNSYARGLVAMMGGSLEADERQSQQAAMKPDFYDTKPKAEWSEEDKKAAKEYERRVTMINEENEKHKKALESELRKQESGIEELRASFEARMLTFFHEKLATDEMIYQLQLRAVILMRKIHAFHVIQKHIERVSQEIIDAEASVKESLMDLPPAKELYESAQKSADACAARDRDVERAVRKAFAHVPGLPIETVLLLVRRRYGAGSTPGDKANKRNTPLDNSSTEGALATNPTATGDALTENDLPATVALTAAQLAQLNSLRVRKLGTENEMHAEQVRLDRARRIQENARQAFELRQANLGALVKVHKQLEETLLRAKHDGPELWMLKQGQIEVPRAPVVSDYSQAVLIHRREVELLNGNIRALARQKIDALKEMRNYRRGILGIEWENRVIDFQTADLHQKTRDIQLIRVTKQMQQFVTSGATEVPQAEQAAAVGSRLEQLDALIARQAESRIESEKKLRKKIARRRQQIAVAERELQQLSSSCGAHENIIVEYHVPSSSVTTAGVAAAPAAGGNSTPAVSQDNGETITERLADHDHEKKKHVPGVKTELCEKLAQCNRISLAMRAQEGLIMQLAGELNRWQEKTYPVLPRRSVSGSPGFLPRESFVP